MSIWDKNILVPGLRPERHLTIQERFDEWLDSEDGRFVYGYVRDRALDMVARGWKHFGIGALWEAARYDRSVQVGPNAGFKLNDHFRSRMARLLMADEPALADFFEIRGLRAA